MAATSTPPAAVAPPSSDEPPTLKWTISPLPERWTSDDLRKALKALGIEHQRVTKVFNQTFAKIGFVSIAQLSAAKVSLRQTAPPKTETSSVSSSETAESSSTPTSSSSSSSSSSESETIPPTTPPPTEDSKDARGYLPGCPNRVVLAQHNSQTGRLRTQRKREREASYALFARNLRQRVTDKAASSTSTTSSSNSSSSGESTESEVEAPASWEEEIAWASELDEVNKRILTQTMPLWGLAYHEQVAWKNREMGAILRTAVREVREATRYAPQEWMKKLNRGDSICPFLGVVECPASDRWYYRSKTDFTIGQSVKKLKSGDDDSDNNNDDNDNDNEDKEVDSDNKQTADDDLDNADDVLVGFTTGDMASGHSCVGPPTHVRITSKAALQVRDAFQSYLHTHTTFPPFAKSDKSGFWRSLVVRNSQRTGEIMVFIQAAEDNAAKIIQQRRQQQTTTSNTDDLPTSQELVQLEKQEVTEHLRKHVEGIVSILWLNWSGIANAVDTSLPVETLFGQSYYTERLFDLNFRVSAHSFFQNNVGMAEVLFKTVQDWIAASSDSILFDVCCGTGVIGLSMASRVTQVIGVDIAEQAIADAKVNAELNNLTNCKFEAGKAEDVLPRQIQAHQGEAMCAIVDPARAGLHPTVINALRRCEKIKRLVYVSCNPNALIKDMKDLCRTASKTLPGAAFRPVKAQAFDLFPFTEHVELVTLFERE